ncbi:MAG TPA: hypothetical protein PL185_02590, partial [Flavobacteriales bacterium]|nr:hypothetical protein [Flavobacteriales bacterium]
ARFVKLSKLNAIKTAHRHTSTLIKARFDKLSERNEIKTAHRHTSTLAHYISLLSSQTFELCIVVLLVWGIMFLKM